MDRSTPAAVVQARRESRPHPIVGLFLATLLSGCPVTGERGRDDDDAVADDDDAANDDDSLADDDDSLADDDDSLGDDDDDPFTPVIEAIDTCQTVLVGIRYGRFDLEVRDPDGDLLAPVVYRLQIDNGPLVTLEFPSALEHGGTLGHLERIGTNLLPDGSEHDFIFQVLDAAGHGSDLYSVSWTIPSSPNIDPC
ncbi:MAG: hypothetical protein VX498_04245 [Myxococcota bacterium]|nr:hypothetical protein [Myxococcota bacterium]